jgi:ferric-dicitrate binding protein FerR (iron transport regulator)
MILLPEHIATILEKQLKGLQSSEETQLLDVWRMEKEEHELLYQQLVKLWKESGVVLEEPVYNADKAWNRLDLALKRGKDNTRRNLLMAACLTGILVLAGWVFFSKKEITIVASNNANKQLTLPDGSAVVLRSGASITFPKVFSERAVKLTGEAYFDVRPDKDHPFRIQTPRARLEVLGTSFVINSTGTYDRLTVASGKVAFINKAEDRHVVSAQEVAVLNDKGFNVAIVKDSNYLSWQTGIIKFDNTPISQVAVELSDYYNLYIQPDSGIMDVTITAKFDHQSIQEVLEEIKLFANISYINQHDTILLVKPN